MVMYRREASKVFSVFWMKSKSWERSVDRLIVDVQVYGPTETSGSLEVSGTMEILGSDCPRVVPVVLDEVLCTVGVPEPEEETEVTWRANSPFDDGKLDSADCERGMDEINDDMGAKTERGTMLVGRLAVDPGAVSGREAGMATGQKLHTCLP